MMLPLELTLGQLLALPQAERIATMRALTERAAALGDYRLEPTPPNTQQGDGSVGVMRMPTAYPGTLLATKDDDDDAG
jgi:hypothetical protein